MYLLKPETTGANIVLSDMDDVMAGFSISCDELIRRHFPDIAVIQDRTGFYYKDAYSDREDVCSVIYRENRSPGFIRNFPVVDGAIQGWQRIIEAGFIPRVASSPIEDHPTIIAEKKEWLEEHFVPAFGYWVVDTAIFDRDKSGYDASSMIDDRPTLRNIEKARWQHIVFSQSYNRSVETEFRLEDWNDPALEDLLARAKAQYLAKVA